MVNGIFYETIMKKIFFLSLISLFALTTNAQTDDKESAALAKEAAKALKAQQKADLQAFKEKQKADLAAFIEKQKSQAAGTVSNAVTIPELKTKADSVAHIFGIAQSASLKQYMTSNLGIDSAHVNDFTQGILDNVNVDLSDPSKKAYNAGSQIAGQLINMNEAFSKDYYAAEPNKTMDLNIIATSIVSGILGNNDIDPEEANKQFRDIMTKRQAENKEELYGANRIAGEKWLEENKKKDGVIVLPSGLQYKVINMGTGEKPTATDKVKVNYEGKLIDGTVFDSSYQRGKEATFQVNQVIKGWTEGLQKMPVGSKWELYIPYQLAYGDRETGKDIKPYSALIFTVDLLDIESKDKAKTTTTDKKADKTSKTSVKKK